MYKTGIAACDALNELHIQGNIVPRIWVKTIVKGNLQSPKPHHLAINILSDIVYWYRPTEMRDEATGQLLGFKKKFKSDLLQRSYEDLADTYGCSNDTVKEAVVFLEKLGVIQREFRDKTVGGVRCNNIMYLGLDVSRLKELTYPSVEISMEGGGKSPCRGEEISTEAVGESPRTNTKNTRTNISSQNTHSIPLAQETAETLDETASEGVSESELLDEVETVLFEQKAVPYHYQQDEARMLCAVRSLTAWYELGRAHFHSDLEFSSFQLLVDCLAEIACQTQARTYNGSHVASGSKVIEKINECMARDGNLYHFVEETVDDFTTAAGNAPIKNPRGYMKSVAWTSLVSYKAKFEASFACSFT